MNPEAKFLLEQFERLINNHDFQIDTHGPLLNPATEIHITRTSSLEIELDVISTNSDSASIEQSYPTGALIKNSEIAELTNILGHRIVLNGIHPICNSRSDNYIAGQTRLSQKSIISSLDIYTRTNDSTEYLIEHLANVDKSRYVWPDASTFSQSTKWGIQFGHNSDGFTLETSISNESMNSNCIHFSIEGINGVIGFCDDPSSGTIIKPGFIIYRSAIPHHTREKIRNCISFTLGMMIVYLGHSEYSSDWQLLKVHASRGYDIGGMAYKIAVSPPAPLSLSSANLIDVDCFYSMLRGLYENYDRMKFNHLLWAYWHALSAVLHISGVHYGAGIEHIINSWLNINGSKISKTLIENDKWTFLRDNFLKCLANEALDDSVRSILNNKICSNLNQMPASILADKVLDQLGIQLTDVEKKAWVNRNKAAHGMEVTESNAIETIQNVKILWTILTRLIIRCSSGSSHYINYAEIGHPIMKI